MLDLYSDQKFHPKQVFRECLISTHNLEGNIINKNDLYTSGNNVT